MTSVHIRGTPSAEEGKVVLAFERFVSLNEIDMTLSKISCAVQRMIYAILFHLRRLSDSLAARDAKAEETYSDRCFQRRCDRPISKREAHQDRTGGVAVHFLCLPLHNQAIG